VELLSVWFIAQVVVVAEISRQVEVRKVYLVVEQAELLLRRLHYPVVLRL
jgi:hypothetical protein